MEQNICSMLIPYWNSTKTTKSRENKREEVVEIKCVSWKMNRWMVNDLATPRNIHVRHLTVPKYISSNYALWNWRNNHRVDSGIHRTHCEMDLSLNSTDHLTSISFCSEWCITVTFGISWISVSSEPVSSNPHEIWLVPFPQCTIILVSSHRFLWEMLEY